MGCALILSKAGKLFKANRAGRRECMESCVAGGLCKALRKTRFVSLGLTGTQVSRGVLNRRIMQNY